MKKCDDYLPESQEKGPQQPAGSALPEQTAQRNGQQGGAPKISLADPEHQHQPGLKGTEDKQQVRQDRKPGPQGPEKPIPQPQHSPQHQPRTAPLDGDHRNRHPKNRFQPPSRGSS